MKIANLKSHVHTCRFRIVLARPRIRTKSGYFDAFVSRVCALLRNVILRYSLAPISLQKDWLRYRYVKIFENISIRPSTRARRPIRSEFKKYILGSVFLSCPGKIVKPYCHLLNFIDVSVRRYIPPFKNRW